MNDTIAQITGTLLGTIVGGGVVVLGQWLVARQQERQALTELALKTAIENWRAMAEKTDKLKMPGHTYGPGPLDGYLIHTLALMEILRSRRKLTPAALEKSLLELDAIGQTLRESLDPKHKQQNQSDRFHNG